MEPPADPDDVFAGLVGGAMGIAEIAADGVLNLLAAVEQPKNDKERHHRGDKIGVGDFPRAAVVARRARPSSL